MPLRFFANFSVCDYRAVCGLDVQKHPGQVREVPNRNAKEFFEEAGKEAL